MLAPLLGAVVAIAFADFPQQRRILTAAMCVAMVGGAAAALARSAASDPVSWRGFSADPWTALLALGAVLAIVAGIARAGGRADGSAAQAALFAASAAGLAPLLVRDLHLLAVTLPVSTLAFAGAAFVSSRRETPSLRSPRAIAALALSDVLTLIALGTAVSSGAALPPELSIGAGATLLAGVAIRLGLVPLWWGPSDALAADPAVGSVWLGVVRAQGLLLLPFAVTADRRLAYAAAAAGGATALAAATRSLRDPGLGPAATAGIALAVLGIALGGPVALWGSTLCVAAVFLASPAWYAGGVHREASRPTLGVWPAGALLPGAVLVAGAAFDAAAVRAGFLGFALPALAATLALGVTVAAGIVPNRPGPRGRGDRLAASLWAFPVIAAAVALATLPARAVHGLAFPIADTLGVGRLLRVGAEAGIAEDVALVMVASALLAFLIGPGRAGSGGPPERTPSALLPRGAAIPFIRFPISMGVRGWAIAGTVFAAAAIGVAIRIYVVAAGRGFL